MILSNEPGYYKPGEYGIRIENLVLVVDAEIDASEGKYLTFETLTHVPLDRRLVDKDLLTPREDIVKRLHAAAEGDFVIAFYNPVSRRRRTLLAEARDILLQHRPADTPVMLASSLGRPEEHIRYRKLSELEVDEVDMLTVVLVGSSHSRLAQLGEGPRMYTPRGYARKIDGDLAS